MKILFTSDWQLGAGAELGQGDYGPGSRFADQLAVLDQIRMRAAGEEASLIVMLGDAFERSRPAPHEILAVQEFVRAAISQGADVLFLLGNHDARGAALPSALEIFADHGCVVALQPSLYPFEAQGVVLAVLPWASPGTLAAAIPDVDRDTLNDAAATALVGGAKLLLERCRIEYPNCKPILCGHWAVSGAALPTGLDTAMLREPVLPLDEISGSGYALAAFGHIHKPQVLATAPTPTFYAGAPCVMNWGETEFEHGVWVYDSNGAGALKFHAIEDPRRFVTLDEDFTEASPYVPFSAPVPPGAVVRARYTVPQSRAGTVDQAALRRQLIEAGASKVIFRPTIVREERARVSDMSRDLDDRAALELWIGAQGVNGSVADRLREVHAEYVAKALA